MNDDFVCVLAIIMGAVFLFCITFVMCFSMEKFSGEQIAKRLGYKSEYSIFTGTILEKPNGEKILLDKLRYNELN